MDAHSITTDGATKAKLNTLRDGMIKNISSNAISQKLKNAKYSGDPKSGAVEVSRFKNATAKDYGTARTNGKGDLLQDSKITVLINQKKELVEEVSKHDLAMYGIEGIVEARQEAFRKSAEAELDRAFFAEAVSAGSEVTTTGAKTMGDVLELAIQGIETTKNDHVDGVEREDIRISLNPLAFGKARNFLDTLKTVSTDNGVKEIGYFHGVQIESTTRQTAAIVAMIDGAVAEPVLFDEYQLEKIPLSNDYSLQLFFTYGVKALTPDLIKKVTTLPEGV